jgi:hypothetical protein
MIQPNLSCLERGRLQAPANLLMLSCIAQQENAGSEETIGSSGRELDSCMQVMPVALQMSAGWRWSFSKAYVQVLRHTNYDLLSCFFRVTSISRELERMLVVLFFSF